MPSRSLAVCAWACDETTASGSGTGQREPQHSPASWLSASIETEPGQLQPLQHLLCNTFDAIDTHAFDVCVFAQPPLDHSAAHAAQHRRPIGTLRVTRLCAWSSDGRLAVLLAP
jgi:hypothetical protein